MAAVALLVASVGASNPCDVSCRKLTCGAMLQASPTAMWMAFTRVGCFHRAQSASALASRAAASAETFFGYEYLKVI